MSDHPPIPEPLWQRLREFLDAGRTGQITLNVGHGVVTSAEFKERVESRGASPPVGGLATRRKLEVP
jgi:hypothetical protein